MSALPQISLGEALRYNLRYIVLVSQLMGRFRGSKAAFLLGRLLPSVLLSLAASARQLACVAAPLSILGPQAGLLSLFTLSIRI